MELREFLNRFLPDFKQKEIDFADNKIAFHIRIKAETQAFYEKYFPEALQNFADKICERQRENCHNYFKKQYEIGLAEIGGEPNIPVEVINIHLGEELINSVEQPKIEELLTT